jgi:hypothetical protein
VPACIEALPAPSICRTLYLSLDRLCSLVVRVPATDPEVPGSIPGATRFSEK